MKPTNVRVALLRYNMVVIQFAIPTISYTPETYHIVYGTNPADLQHQSEVHAGNTDVSTVGEVQSITLEPLKHNTMYHYKIVSRNSAFNVTSDMQRFQTPALGELLPILLLIL